MSQKQLPPHHRLTPWLAMLLALSLLTVAGGFWQVGGDAAYAQTLPTLTPEPTATTVPVLEPPPGPGEYGVRPGDGGSFGSGDETCFVVVTPDDFVEVGRINLIDLPVNDLPNRDLTFLYIRACDVHFRPSGAPGAVPQPGDGSIQSYPFANPVDACFPYSDDDLARAQGDPARLLVVIYDPVAMAWVELPVSIDQTNRMVCGRMSYAGIVALAVRSDPLGALPGTSGNLPDATPAAAAPAAPPAALAPTALPAQTAAERPDAVATAAAPSSRPAAPPSTQATTQASAAPATTSFVPYLLLGLLVAALVAVAILVLSRTYFIRATEEE